jgi:hypothetical protein
MAMNCFDCAQLGRVSDAVAVCVGCGAAVCLQHGQADVLWLTRIEVINRAVPVEPPARAVRCAVCAAANDPPQLRRAGVRR